MPDQIRTNPSLLERESRGGDEAQRGMAFQLNVLLARLPFWLSHDGFAMLTQEAVGDIEIKFFEPGRGERLELIEAKNHRVAPAEFWGEIKRFRDLHDADPCLYRRFELVCTGFAPDIEPLVNALRRLRGPSDMYPEDSAIAMNSFEDFTKLVHSRNHSDEDAEFLYDMVDLTGDLSSAQENGQALFKEAFAMHLRHYDLRSQTLTSICSAIGDLLSQGINKTITRGELEAKIRECVPPSEQPPLGPICIHTLHDDARYQGNGLCLEWAEFFGGAERRYPSAEAWQTGVVSPLKQTCKWICEHRDNRRIRLSGSRRLSSAFAFGFAFPAVGGFQIEMEYRGEVWSSSEHDHGEHAPYTPSISAAAGSGDELVVSIGVLHSIDSEVERFCSTVGLSSAPKLHIYGEAPIASPQQANALSSHIKRLICQAVAQTGAKKIHLFTAVPSYMALFLGHRANPLSSIQCYEHVGPGHYVATCLLV